eukprot:6182931-Lingulodinium_polyedra.AAC.1
MEQTPQQPRAATQQPPAADAVALQPPAGNAQQPPTADAAAQQPPVPDAAAQQGPNADGTTQTTTAAAATKATAKPKIRPIQVGEWIRKVVTKRINNVEQTATQRKQLHARQWGGTRVSGGAEAIAITHL